MGKAFWLGFAAYLLPTFPLAYLWHLRVFAEAYHRLDLYRPDVIIPLGLLSMIIQAVVFSAVYPRLFSTAPEDLWRSAFGFFLLFGLLAFSFIVLPVAAKYRMASVREFIALETAFTLLQFAVVSPLMALAHRQSV